MSIHNLTNIKFLIGICSKNIFTNALIGVLIGAVVSMLGIFVYSIFDVVIRDKKKLEDNFDFPVLGVIPRYDVPVEQDKEGV